MSVPLITQIDVGRLRLDLSDAYELPEDHPDGGPRDIPLLCYHVAVGGRSVLVDAPRCEFTGERAIYEVPDYEPPPALVEQLSAHGVAAADVDAVVITHAHFDHFNAITHGASATDGREITFPNARHYLGAADWQPEAFGDVESDTLEVVGRSGLLELVDGERDLGDGISILPAPGETLGHQIVRVRSGGEEVYLTGDLFHQTIELRVPERHARWANAEQSASSKASLIERASRTGATVYFAHIHAPHRVERRDGAAIWRAI